MGSNLVTENSLKKKIWQQTLHLLKKKKKKSWQQTSIGVCMSHGVGMWKGIRTGWESFYNLFRFRLGNI